VRERRVRITNWTEIGQFKMAVEYLQEISSCRAMHGYRKSNPARDHSNIP